jgi:hypothetical protein
VACPVASVVAVEDVVVDAYRVQAPVGLIVMEYPFGLVP